VSTNGVGWILVAGMGTNRRRGGRFIATGDTIGARRRRSNRRR
jgi:hypothetical protein